MSIFKSLKLRENKNLVSFLIYTQGACLRPYKDLCSLHMILKMRMLKTKWLFHINGLC